MPRCERREQAMTCVDSANFSSLLGLLIDNHINCSGRGERRNAWALAWWPALGAVFSAETRESLGVLILGKKKNLLCLIVGSCCFLITFSPLDLCSSHDNVHAK